MSIKKICKKKYILTFLLLHRRIVLAAIYNGRRP